MDHLRFDRGDYLFFAGFRLLARVNGCRIKSDMTMKEWRGKNGVARDGPV